MMVNISTSFTSFFSFNLLTLYFDNFDTRRISLHSTFLSFRDHLLPRIDLRLQLRLKLTDVCLSLPHVLLLLRHKHRYLPFEFDHSLHHSFPLFVLSRDLSIVRILHRLAQVMVRHLVAVIICESVRKYRVQEV